jgi:hypothetical protein
MSETTPPPESSHKEKPKVKVEFSEFSDLDFFEHNQLAVVGMTKSSKPCEVGEANKLIGIQNYNVWKIKMEAILRRERLWG